MAVDALRPHERRNRQRVVRRAVVAEGRAPRIRPVDVELPESQVEARIAGRRRRDAGRIVDLGHEVRRTRNGRRAVEVSRQLADVLAARRIVLGLVEEHDASGLALQHLAALEGEGTRPRRRDRVTRELVRRHVVAVRPDAELRVVEEHVRTEQERVQVVGARRIGARRDGDAFAVLLAAVGRSDELRQQPAVRQLVVDDDRITFVVCLALAVRVRPQLVDLGRRTQHGARLRVHGEARVDHLDVLRQTRLAVRVGWQAAAVARLRTWFVAERETHAVEVLDRRRDRPGSLLLLDDGVLGVGLACGLQLLVVARSHRRHGQGRDHRKAAHGRGHAVEASIDHVRAEG